MLKNEMLEKRVWAVVGVTNNKERFGYKIFRTLMEHGYETYGVNPKYEEIDGKKIYPNLKSIPKNIEVVDVVIPPKAAMELLDEIKEQGIEYVWFQPGTYDEEVMEKAKRLGLKALFHDCVYATLVSE